MRQQNSHLLFVLFVVYVQEISASTGYLREVLRTMTAGVSEFYPVHGLGWLLPRVVRSQIKLVRVKKRKMRAREINYNYRTS